MKFLYYYKHLSRSSVPYWLFCSRDYSQWNWSRSQDKLIFCQLYPWPETHNIIYTGCVQSFVQLKNSFFIIVSYTDPAWHFNMCSNIVNLRRSGHYTTIINLYLLFYDRPSPLWGYSRVCACAVGRRCLSKK